MAAAFNHVRSRLDISHYLCTIAPFAATECQVFRDVRAGGVGKTRSELGSPAAKMVTSREFAPYRGSPACYLSF